MIGIMRVKPWLTMLVMSGAALSGGCTNDSDASPSAGVLSGGLTEEQAHRRGVDASRDCQEEPARAYLADGLDAQAATFLGGFQTDEAGQQRWSAEASGGLPQRDSDDGQYQQLLSPAPRQYALCWWRGSFTVSSGAGERTSSDIVVLQPLDGPPADPVVLISRDGPIPVWAPPTGE